MSDRPTQRDAQLVLAVRDGDRAAFGELFRRHEPVCRRLVMRMLHDDHDAVSEIVQEAALQAYLSLHRLRCPDRFGAWLCGIALNLARRSWVARRRVVPRGDLHDLETFADGEPPAAASDVTAMVEDAVAGLPPGQREATLLFYWCGLTHAEISARLGVSVNAVKNRLHHARHALEPTLAAALGHEEVAIMETAEQTRWVAVSVTEVRRGDHAEPDLRPHVVVLQEPGGGRTLPIWVGRAEATALAVSLESVDMPRPMTYQLIAALLGAAGTHVREVRVARLVGDTFYATLLLQTPAATAEVDARPSDALNLALITGAPITVDEALLGGRAATGRAEWRGYPTDRGGLVAELRQTERTERTERTEPAGREAP